MPLDDFFAKKEKKKVKKKRNPLELIDKLTKETEKQCESNGDAVTDPAKFNNFGKDDEWEALDDEEKDIDFQSIRINRLDVAKQEVSTKQSSKDTTDKDGSANTEEDKTVWGHKPVEPPVVEEPQPEPEPARPRVYVPIHLRQGDAKVSKTPKPNVESASDFPTLDAAVTAEVTKKTEEHKEIDDGSWEQAGAPRKHTRTPDTLPIAATSGPPAYVPPALRQGGSSCFASPRNELQLDSRDTRARHDFPNRHSGIDPVRRTDGLKSLEPPDTSFDDWKRGEKISSTAHFPGGSSFASPMSAAPHFSTMGSAASGWDRGVNVKTFRESNRDKADFTLVQSNRFAGLDET
ncbi:hypothetical protein PHET_07405 [Paragonimus heterotremus]|uniref:Uncharacterized protein n=1 Tax=Paragonimus heterotremus TaxID=100268 RepID=A0A8J4THT7_9TREM|nr:hypothetical protein PHET_07405 [Paragonimus heterotremus]